VPREGWVLYDGYCGFCSRWVPHWAPTLARRGFAIATLDEGWVAEKMQLSQDELHVDIRLLLSEGRNLQGADVYRYVMRRIWWAWPLYLLATAPVLRNVFDAAYRSFADNRFWISRRCHMPARARPGSGASGR
jgi:predicted DCC family thiol-disulfide oxidoreductase YuxK